jgi:hypothetical protein
MAYYEGLVPKMVALKLNIGATGVVGGYSPREQIAMLGLDHGYPSPFRTQTTVKYHIFKEERISLKLYNINGQLVRTLLDGQISPGVYTGKLDGRNQQGQQLPNGVYLIKLSGNGQTAIEKTLLIR